jgi:hypothetical protein
VDGAQVVPQHRPPPLTEVYAEIDVNKTAKMERLADRSTTGPGGRGFPDPRCFRIGYNGRTGTVGNPDAVGLPLAPWR